MTHNKSLRRKLQGMVSLYDPYLCSAPNRYQFALMESCPELEREIELIVMAINYEIVNEMRRLRYSLPPSLLLPKLVRWFLRQTGICEDEAIWTVDSWAMALGMITFVDDVKFAQRMPESG